MTPTLSDLARSRTRAMAAMNLRAVINDTHRLVYLSRPAASTGPRTVIARHQPRDARGRFVSYETYGRLSERDLRVASHVGRAAD